MDNALWLPGNESKGGAIAQIGVYVSYSDIFPDSTPTVTELKDNLSNLSRTDALIWCAKINLAVSNATHHDSLAKQGFAVKTIFSEPEIKLITKFVRSRPPNSAFVFFRAQLLDLMQWIATFCRDSADDGQTFEDPEVRTAFGKAALLASQFWGKRVYHGKVVEGSPPTDENRQRSLGAFRMGTEGGSTRIDPLMAIGRGRSLFTDHLAKIRPGIEKEFVDATGLGFDSFYGLLSILAANCLLRRNEDAPTDVASCLFGESHLVDYPVLAKAFHAYVGFAGQSPDDMTAAACSNQSPDGTLVGGSGWMKSLRKRPLLRTIDGRCIVLDSANFSEHAAVGPLFAMLDGKANLEVNQLFTDFGAAFENYGKAILRRMYPAVQPPLVDRLMTNPQGTEQNGGDVEIADAGLIDVEDLALFEIKAVWLPDKHAEADDPNEYLQEFRRRYAAFEAAQLPKKGIGQLAAVISKLAKGHLILRRLELSAIRRIIPVLVAYDPLIDAGGHPWYLSEQFRSALRPDKVLSNGGMLKGKFVVLPPIVISVDDLEILETSVEHFGLMDLFRDYSNAHPNRMCSLHNYLTSSKYSDRLYPSRSLASSALGAMEVARTLLRA